MKKIDFKKELPDLYSCPKGRIAEIAVPRMTFLMIDGEGDPNVSEDFSAAVQALYGCSYRLKFALKKARLADYAIPPLEGLWWADDMEDYEAGKRERWKWTLMIMQPEAVTRERLSVAAKELAAKKELPSLRLEEFEEGRAAQLLHIGSYASEAPAVRRLHQHIRDRGMTLRGRHHEIYLGDPRRAAADKLRTLIRQPFS
jgi:hypothetical protein